MSVTPSPIGGFAAQFFDNNGVILSGGKIYTYAAGTTTPQATYTSAVGITPHANPIILDSAGRVPGGEIWLTDGLVYKFVIETATGILIGTYDNITGVNSNFVNYTIQEEVITATAGQTVFNLSTINYTPGANSLSVYIDGVNQYVGDSYLETDSNTVTFTSGVHVGGEVKFTTAIQISTGAIDSSNVGFIQAGTGAVGRTAQAKMRDIISPADFNVIPDGTTDNTTAFATLMTYAQTVASATGGASPIINFPAGVYAYATSPNFAVSNVHLDCAPGVVFKHTGTGVAFNIDGGAATETYRFRLTGMPTIQGNANSTYGLDVRGLNHSQVEANVRDVATAVMRTRFAVCTDFKIRSSGLGIGGQSPNPANGLILDSRGVGETTTACTFNVIIEQLPGIGLDLVGAVMCQFIGGTSEGNTAGNVRIRSGSANNTFHGVDFEFSAGYDILCEGPRNTFINCYSDSLSTFSGDSNQVIGGLFNNIVNTGSGNIFDGCGYAAAAGTFTDSGSQTNKRAVRNLTTTVIDNNKFQFPVGSWLLNQSGAETFLFGAAEFYLKNANGILIVRNVSDQECGYVGSPTGASGDSIVRLNGSQVVKTRRTGWTAPTGTATRTTFNTATVTTAQLAERVKALIDDLDAAAGHGLIGP